MPAYCRKRIDAFILCNPVEITGTLQQAYAVDGFASQYTRQVQSWTEEVALLQAQLQALVALRPEARDWIILLEYPLYRLRRRIDVVILAGPTVVVVECKVGSQEFRAEDRRQVEEYALDLRDFHAASNCRRIVPILWSTQAEALPYEYPKSGSSSELVAQVIHVGTEGLTRCLASLPIASGEAHIVAEEWDRSA